MIHRKKKPGDAKVYNYKSGQKMYEKVYELPWEVEVLKTSGRKGLSADQEGKQGKDYRCGK